MSPREKIAYRLFCTGMIACEVWPLPLATLLSAGLMGWSWPGWLIGVVVGVAGFVFWQWIGWVMDDEDYPQSLIGDWLERRRLSRPTLGGPGAD